MCQPLSTPVLFLIYRRPDTTRAVFQAIRAARPSRLLVVADGPRAGAPHERAACDEARRIATAVDWDCDVLTNFAAVNMGLRERVSSGLDWAFEHTEELIILEDDCLPDPSFFPFCAELLERYRDDPRVFSISGNDFRFRLRPIAADYRFSRYVYIWGWATWRRAWIQRDSKLEDWPELKRSGELSSVLGDEVAQFWTEIFDSVWRGDVETWDWPWQLTCFRAGGLTVHPWGNLVSNIGTGAAGTHPMGRRDPLANIPVRTMRFPLRHPLEVARNIAADDWLQRRMLKRTRFARLRLWLRRAIHTALR